MNCVCVRVCIASWRKDRPHHESRGAWNWILRRPARIYICIRGKYFQIRRPTLENKVNLQRRGAKSSCLVYFTHFRTYISSTHAYEKKSNCKCANMQRCDRNFSSATYYGIKVYKSITLFFFFFFERILSHMCITQVSFSDKSKTRNFYFSNNSIK